MRALQKGVVDEKQAFLAMTVGWCIEWLQAFFLVADDMMDHSITRRGQPCWYKVPKVGLNACNDCIILEACIYKILKKHVSKLPCYLEARAGATQAAEHELCSRVAGGRACWRVLMRTLFQPHVRALVRTGAGAVS